MKKVIIIDDSETIRDDLKNELKTSGSYKILTAEDGLLGLEVIKNNQDCSMIITDLNMPNMDGFGLLEALKKENICPDTPKIILTTESFLGGDYSEKLKDRGKELGVEAWVPKGAGSDTFVIIHGVIKRIFRKQK